jgi:hypothetical protein
LKACACYLHYSYQHIFLHTSQGPVSELPIRQPREIKSILTFLWFGSFIMLFYTSYESSFIRTRFYNHDLAITEEPKARRKDSCSENSTASLLPSPCMSTHPCPPATMTSHPK